MQMNEELKLSYTTTVKIKSNEAYIQPTDAENFSQIWFTNMVKDNDLDVLTEMQLCNLQRNDCDYSYHCD